MKRMINTVFYGLIENKLMLMTFSSLLYFLILVSWGPIYKSNRGIPIYELGNFIVGTLFFVLFLVWGILFIINRESWLIIPIRGPVAMIVGIIFTLVGSSFLLYSLIRNIPILISLFIK
jgi:hypothetical protein